MTFLPSFLNSELARERTRVTPRRVAGARLVRPAAPDPRHGVSRGGPDRRVADR